MGKHRHSEWLRPGTPEHQRLLDAYLRNDPVPAILSRFGLKYGTLPGIIRRYGWPIRPRRISDYAAWHAKVREIEAAKKNETQAA